MIDAHVHLWDPARFRMEWLSGLPTLDRAFLPDDFRKAAGKTAPEKMIFVECGCELAQNIAEADWISGLAEKESRIAGIVAQAALERGAKARIELEQLAKRRLVKGVRRSLQDERGTDLFLGADFVAGARLLETFGFTFDVCIRHDQLAAAAELARRAPQVTFVLDHLGKPDVRGEKREPWAGDLKDFAALPNTVCKISGLATEGSWEHWKPEGFRYYFDKALESFGVERVMFGGDWPVLTLATTYERWLETIVSWSAGLGEAVRTQLFQTNAERIYRV